MTEFKQHQIENASGALPSVTFLVHSFNRIRNVQQLYTSLRGLGSHNIVVCDDGSIDGSRSEWLSLLQNGENEVLICSNDLHEIRILDRAIRMIKTDLVCIVQDDDHIPSGTDWLDDIRQRFVKLDNLAIVGGFMGFHGFNTDPAYVVRIWGDMRFQFVDHVNIGPYFIRTAVYQRLGGWNYEFSKVGQPGICFDNELCIRAWLYGFTVGYRFVPFKGPAGVYAANGGTALFSPRLRRSNQLLNEQRIFQVYGRHAEKIRNRVERANAA